MIVFFFFIVVGFFFCVCLFVLFLASHYAERQEKVRASWFPSCF